MSEVHTYKLYSRRKHLWFVFCAVCKPDVDGCGWMEFRSGGNYELDKRDSVVWREYVVRDYENRTGRFIYLEDLEDVE
jgi:hypothetical protein|tara:strand:+ start:222 stop:455 length:234 start_codon:yes stop_codon:yes gene_type:complete